MLKYLNNFMDENRDFDSPRAKRFARRFPEAVKIVDAAIDKPFRPKGLLNSAVLEAVMVTVLENEQINAEELAARYPKLLSDREFLTHITGGTTDTLVLKTRMKSAQKFLA